MMTWHVLVFKTPEVLQTFHSLFVKTRNDKKAGFAPIWPPTQHTQASSILVEITTPATAPSRVSFIHSHHTWGTLVGGVTDAAAEEAQPHGSAGPGPLARHASTRQ